MLGLTDWCGEKERIALLKHHRKLMRWSGKDWGVQSEEMLSRCNIRISFEQNLENLNVNHFELTCHLCQHYILQILSLL